MHIRICNQNVKFRKTGLVRLTEVEKTRTPLTNLKLTVWANAWSWGLLLQTGDSMQKCILRVVLVWHETE